MAAKTAEMKCFSCGKRIEAEKCWVEFPCPQCGKVRVMRCDRCKKLINQYECPECKFVGP